MKINTKIKQINIESEVVTKLKYIRISGTANLLLMIGEEVTTNMMYKCYYDYENFSEKTIFSSVNDGGYGGCKILSANILIETAYEVNNNPNIIIHVPVKKVKVDMINRKITYKKV